MSDNIIWHHATVTRSRREVLNGHKAGVIWFTGLSGAGKSTLAHALEEELYREDREMVRKLIPHGDFIEIYCKSSLAAREKRDVKGLYRKARAGEIKNYTGIDSPYEEPIKPELVIDTEQLDLNTSVREVLALLNKRG